jgi:hypothetical protein
MKLNSIPKAGYKNNSPSTLDFMSDALRNKYETLPLLVLPRKPTPAFVWCLPAGRQVRAAGLAARQSPTTQLTAAIGIFLCCRLPQQQYPNKKCTGRKNIFPPLPFFSAVGSLCRRLVFNQRRIRLFLCLFLLCNIIWLLCGGLYTALVHVVFGLLLTITIIGIPFARQHFKLIEISMMPFGKSIQ